MAEIPKEFHFVFGLAPQREPMHVIHYLCLESCRRVNQPAAMYFHYRHEPHGEWWERIRPRLTLRCIAEAASFPDPARYAASDEGRFIRDHGLTYAHEADYLRLAILLEAGGVYADMDTLFVRPLPSHLYAKPFVLGEEAPLPGADGVLRPSLCNALIMARPGASFAQRWLGRMRECFDGTWSRHSNQEASRLWGEFPGEIHVVPQPCFYKHAASRRGLRTLLEGRDRDAADVYSLHLWAHLWWEARRTDFSVVHAGVITPDHIRSKDTTYTLLARRFLD
ncbi:MAG TPA: glycosyltransferase [Casimicrobiaceae bacterium]|nr:glycosyltransferase [Casimicrobiaceae bacterium]